MLRMTLNSLTFHVKHVNIHTNIQHQQFNISCLENIEIQYLATSFNKKICEYDFN